jgi:hypothetical protein
MTGTTEEHFSAKVEQPPALEARKAMPRRSGTSSNAETIPSVDEKHAPVLHLIPDALAARTR